MKKPYDKSDNDTYDEILSNIPAQDIEYHMYRDPDGHVKAGKVVGFFNADTQRKSKDLVLRFATSSKIGLVPVTKIKRETLMPMTLVARYGLKNYTYSQKTPVFFDTTFDQFVVLMDSRFLRDVQIDELFPVSLPSGLRVYCDGFGNKHLGVTYDTMKDVRVKGFGSSQAEKELLAAYTLYNLNLQEGERVIVLRYLSKANDKSNLFGSAFPQLGAKPSTATCVFEYAQAYRFGDRYYFCDEEGTLCQESSFVMDKHGMQTGTSMQGRRAKNDGVQVVVFNYTEEQYAAIKDLHARVMGMHDALSKLFANSINAEDLFDRFIGGALLSALPQPEKLNKDLPANIND